MNIGSETNRPSLRLSRFRTFFSSLICVALVSTSLAIDFDSSFGSAGKFTTTFGESTAQPSSGGSQIFMQPSGRFVVVGTHSQQGTINPRTSGVAIAGLTAGGVLDNSFGTSGKTLVWNTTFHRFLNNSVMNPDGSVVALYQMWESVSNNRPMMVKFTAGGAVDPAFNPDLDITPNTTSPLRIAPASGGKIYVILRNFASTLFSLVRLNSDGSRDATFGSNGVRTVNLNRLNQPRVAILIELPDGKLLIGGSYYTPTFESLMFLARFDTDTNLDRSFGLQGIARIGIDGGSVEPIATLIQPDGKILIGGYWTFLGSTTLLMRLTSRGRPDLSFGTGGIARTSFNDVNGIRGIALASDGRIFVTGSSGAKAIPSNSRLFVMKYTARGTSEGHLVTNFLTNREANANDIVLQADGKMVIAGSTQNLADNNYQLGVARFLP